MSIKVSKTFFFFFSLGHLKALGLGEGLPKTQNTHLV